MLKIEYVWRELLYQAIDKHQANFTIINLARKFKLSTSLISHALAPLRQLGMISVGKNKSSVVDTEKLLYFWATRRNLKKDIIYQTYSPLTPFEREGLMPADVIPTAYSAYHFYYHELPADYENIYFYGYQPAQIKKRFPESLKKKANLFILKPDPYLKSYQRIPTAQIFVDLWNVSDWYAKDFSDALLLKIKEKIGL